MLSRPGGGGGERKGTQDGIGIPLTRCPHRWLVWHIGSGKIRDTKKLHPGGCLFLKPLDKRGVWFENYVILIVTLRRGF